MMLDRIAMAALLLLLFDFSHTPLAQENAASPHWSYSGEEGPARWGDLAPSFSECKLGTQQSPIDIRAAKKAKLDVIEFHYQAVPLDIIDNGHTIQINYASGSYILVGQRRYDLKQFHFHHPSEEKIDGKAFDMVAHLVHSDDSGALAVVAVLLEHGEANRTIERLWKNLPGAKNVALQPPAVTIDARGLLPSGHAYYTFAGSLTTPPCSEGVTWFVLKQPTSISSQQLEAFRKVYPLSARPIQPLHGRTVEASE